MTQTEFEFLREALGEKHNELLKDIVAADNLMKTHKQAQVAMKAEETKTKKAKKEKSK